MVTALGSDGVSGYVSVVGSVSSVTVESSPSVVVDSVSSSLSASIISSVPSHLVGSRKHSVETSLISSSSSPTRIGLSGYSSGT